MEEKIIERAAQIIAERILNEHEEIPVSGTRIRLDDKEAEIGYSINTCHNQTNAGNK